MEIKVAMEDGWIQPLNTSEIMESQHKVSILIKEKIKHAPKMEETLNLLVLLTLMLEIQMRLLMLLMKDRFLSLLTLQTGADTQEEYSITAGQD